MLNRIAVLIKNLFFKIKKNFAFQFYLASLAALAFPIAVLYANVNVPIAGAAVFAIVESAFLLFPYWWIKKSRWTTLIPVYISTIFVECNLLMLSWGGVLLTFRSVFMTGNVNDAVTSNIPALLSPLNFIIIAVLLAYTIWYLYIKKRLKAYQFSRRTSTIATALTFAVFLLVQFSLQAKWRADNRTHDTNITLTDFAKRWNSHDVIRTRDLIYKGYLMYVISNLYGLSESRELNPEEKAQIENYLLSQSDHSSSYPQFAENRKKNLILILVESLNAELIDAEIDSHPIMPNLNGLTKLDGTIQNRNIVTQVIDGTSGDGQLITNTGLLPIREGSANLEFGGTTRFISICDLLPSHSSCVILSESGGTWNIKTTFTSFGFDKVWTTRDYFDKEALWCDDSQMLEFATRQLSELREPFFMECVTISMHIPFDMVKEPMPEWLEKSDLSGLRKRQYLCASYFDTAFGKFVEELKDKGLWGNTVLVVASDHSIGVGDKGNGSGLSYIPMVFLATNTGVTLQLEKTAGQVDIFPTIAEIMNVPDSIPEITIKGTKMPWRGVGGSMLNQEREGAVDPRRNVFGNPSVSEHGRMQEAYEVSNNIIRGNYLSDK